MADQHSGWSAIGASRQGTGLRADTHSETRAGPDGNQRRDRHRQNKNDQGDGIMKRSKLRLLLELIVDAIGVVITILVSNI